MQTKYDGMALLSGISLAYAQLLMGLTKSEDSLSTLDGVHNEDAYALDKNNGPVVNTWFTGFKVVLLISPLCLHFSRLRLFTYLGITKIP